jgi:uncharacterized protein (TIGR02300 family)
LASHEWGLEFVFDSAFCCRLCPVAFSPKTREAHAVAKPELGTKRLCPNCGAKYYDLNRNPIACPRCGAPFDPHLLIKARPVAVVLEEEEIEDDAGIAPEFVPLEEAEDADGDDVPEIEEAEIEDEAEVDDTFLEPEDEDEGDVSDIIGDVDNEEER